MTPVSVNDNWILYDGDCPFCKNYVMFLRIQENLGTIRLVNARDRTEELLLVEKHDLDIDEGMVLHYNGELYFGKNAVVMISHMAKQTGFINGIMKTIFASKTRTSFLYPIMKIGRGLTLKVLGIKKINQL